MSQFIIDHRGAIFMALGVALGWLLRGVVEGIRIETGFHR